MQIINSNFLVLTNPLLFMKIIIFAKNIFI